MPRKNPDSSCPRKRESSEIRRASRWLSLQSRRFDLSMLSADGRVNGQCGAMMASQAISSLARKRYAAWVFAQPPHACGMLVISLAAMHSANSAVLSSRRRSPSSPCTSYFSRKVSMLRMEVKVVCSDMGLVPFSTPIGFFEVPIRRITANPLIRIGFLQCSPETLGYSGCPVIDLNIRSACCQSSFVSMSTTRQFGIA